MKRILLVSLLLVSCGAREIEKTHVFYLHGRIIEEQGRRPTHPEYGTYEYDEILHRLGGEGRVVLSEARPRGTDPDAYAEKIAKQIEDLLAKGVPGRRITVIGASKGAVIAMLVSTKVRSPEVGYVILANCNDWVLQNQRIDLHGQVLSIYEASDSFGGTCEPLFRQSKELGTHREIRLETGLRHGFLYRPIPEWIEPALAWSRGRPPSQAAKEPPWFVVNPEELPSVESVPVFRVCFSGKPPRALEKAELALPAAHPFRRTGGVIVVHTLINAKGQVVKAQILRGPADLQDAVARCLRQWRFEPAVTRDRKPAAVHFTLTLPVYPAR